MLEIRNIEKEFNGAPLLSGISLTIDEGEIVCLLGPSGSGKTTLLRIIAGLEPADRGEILFENQNMRGVPVHLRRFGMMFQDLALFPHKNVIDNVAFGLRMQNLARGELRARVQETLELVGMTGFSERKVDHLSGGEQQRVALARSLAPRPKLLMLDEPLGALDRILREQLITDLRAILKRIGMTAIYVTHDQDEAFAIADRIAIVHNGRIVQVGSPESIYRAPADAFVARFLGLSNLFPGTQRPDGRVETEIGIFKVDNLHAVDSGMVLIRPENVRLSSQGISARVDECIFRAGKFRTQLISDTGARLIVESDHALTVGAHVHFVVDAIEWLAM